MKTTGILRIERTAVYLALGLAIAGGTANAGINPQPFAESPLLGVGLGQTMRITITGAGDLCRATLGFRDAEGRPVSDDTRVRTVSLREGESAFHDLNFNVFTARLGQRYEARALVVYPLDQAAGVCRWSVEIFDRFTKRTMAIFAFPPDPISPISAKTFLAPIGAAYGQTVRLGVVADSPGTAPAPGQLPTPPSPCELECHLHSATGAIVAQKVLKLVPGGSDTLDLSMNGLVRFGERGVINPCCLPAGPGSGAGCKVSVQVFDQITGWTQSLVAR